MIYWVPACHHQSPHTVKSLSPKLCLKSKLSQKRFSRRNSHCLNNFNRPHQKCRQHQPPKSNQFGKRKEKFKDHKSLMIRHLLRPQKVHEIPVWMAEMRLRTTTTATTLTLIHATTIKTKKVTIVRYIHFFQSLSYGEKCFFCNFLMINFAVSSYYL